MSGWWESLVQLRRSDGKKGSGVFISSTEILTAAHVVTRGSAPMALDELMVDVRYRSVLAAPRAVAVLATWSPGTTASDIALVRVDALFDLGLAPIFGHPPPSERTMLEGAGFDAVSEGLRMPSGNVECRVTMAGERLLYTDDFAPAPGMSGGPLCAGLANGVRVAGVLTRRSGSGFVGLSLVASLLDELRARFV
jgi:hypothetical protein